VFALSLATAVVPAPFTTDDRGVVRIGNTRVMLERIVYAFDAGASAEEIVETYPSLKLADVYAAIAFILKNRPEVDAYMAKSEAEAEQIRETWEAYKPSTELRRRIRERARVQ